MKYIKLFEELNTIQQPFFLSADRLYISNELAHKLTPTLEELQKNSNNPNYCNWLYQNQLDFFNNAKNEKGWSISTRINTNIHVGYNNMYRMNIIVYRGNNYDNEFGHFEYYIGGTSGDHEMQGKNMVRATRECNLHLMEKLYPIVKNIKDFYKRMKNKEGFFDIIRNEIIKNPNVAKDGVPDELEEEFGHTYTAFKYNI